MTTSSDSTKQSASQVQAFSPNIISAFSEAAYRGFLSWADPDTKNRECVHLAKLRIGDQESEYYVKLYPAERGKSRGLANEITGYLVLYAMNVPQPPAAYLVKIPLDELFHPPQTWVKNLQGKGKSYWAFCSEKLPGKTAALHFGSFVSDILKNDIESWDKLPDALAADEQMAHTDRHLNNLIRLDAGQYALIDNGRLISEEKNWAPKDMVRDKLYRHRLSEHLWSHRAPKDISSGAALSARASDAKFSAVKSELEYWLTQLGMTKIEHLKLVDFLSWRANHLEDLIKKRYGLLL